EAAVGTSARRRGSASRLIASEENARTRIDDLGHSMLILRRLFNSRYRASSAAITARSPSGPIDTASNDSSAHLVFDSGVDMLASTSLTRRSTMDTGVPAGAAIA